MDEAPKGPDGLEAMAFQLLLQKVTSLEQAVHRLPPLLKKIIDQLEAQATQPDVPIATYVQLYPELHEGASETEDLIEVVAAPVPEAPPVRQARWRFWRWFLREV